MRFGLEFLKAGGDVITDLSIAGQKVHRLSWKDGQTPNSRYPFELYATIYTTALVKKIINGTMNSNPLAKKLFSPRSILMKALGKVASTRTTLKAFGYFFSPNTLESWNCRNSNIIDNLLTVISKNFLYAFGASIYQAGRANLRTCGVLLLCPTQLWLDARYGIAYTLAGWPHQCTQTPKVCFGRKAVYGYIGYFCILSR